MYLLSQSLDQKLFKVDEGMGVSVVIIGNAHHYDKQTF